MKKLFSTLLAVLLIAAFSVQGFAITLDGKKSAGEWGGAAVYNVAKSTSDTGNLIKNAVFYVTNTDSTVYFDADITTASVENGEKLLTELWVGDDCFVMVLDGAPCEYNTDKYNFSYAAAVRNPSSYSIEGSITFKNGLSEKEAFTLQFTDEEGIKSNKFRLSAEFESQKTTAATTAAGTVFVYGETTTEKTTAEKTTKEKTTKEKTTKEKTAKTTKVKTTKEKATKTTKAKTTKVKTTKEKKSSAGTTKENKQNTVTVIDITPETVYYESMSETSELEYTTREAKSFPQTRRFQITASLACVIVVLAAGVLGVWTRKEDEKQEKEEDEDNQ